MILLSIHLNAQCLLYNVPEVSEKVICEAKLRDTFSRNRRRLFINGPRTNQNLCVFMGFVMGRIVPDGVIMGRIEPDGVIIGRIEPDGVIIGRIEPDGVIM